MNKRLPIFAAVVSIAFVASVAVADADRFVIDDFQGSSVDQIPKGWRGRGDDAKKFYKVSIDDKGNKFLRVKNRGTHQFVATEREVDLVKYPWLEWRWRGHALPTGGNENKKSTNDSGAAVNVIIKASKLAPKTIKYTWSSSLKKGTETESPHCPWTGSCHVIVVESGEANLGSWKKVRRNVLEDYKRLFDKDDVDSVEIDGILVMSDGDNTKSYAAADYDDVVFNSK